MFCKTLNDFEKLTAGAAIVVTTTVSAEIISQVTSPVTSFFFGVCRLLQTIFYGAPFSHLFTELKISPIEVHISANQLQISPIHLKISSNQLEISTIKPI